MSKRLLSLSAAALIAASFAVSNVASAAPVVDALALKNAAQSDVQMVWGRGFGWGVGAGLLGGAIIGGALAAPYYGYGYYPPAYGYGYYPAPAYGYPAPAYGGGGDSVAYCARKYRSYDPSTGTFLGTDGARHSCP
jgi:BA14K-like protein